MEEEVGEEVLKGVGQGSTQVVWLKAIAESLNQSCQVNGVVHL